MPVGERPHIACIRRVFGARLTDFGARRSVGWNGVGPGSQSDAVLRRCARPCTVARFFAAVDSAVARYEDGGSAHATRPAAGQTLPPMRKAVGGYYHSLAISTAGRLFSWGCGNFGGENDGQQGFGDLVERTDPAPVDCRAWGADAKVLDAAAGCYHSVVLAEPGAKDSGGAPKVYTWGLNNYGQLARAGLAPDPPRIPRDPTDDSYNDGVPAEVTMPPPPAGTAPQQVRGVGAAFYNTFVLLRSRGALCAGSNQAGQCGAAVGTHSGLRPIPELATTQVAKLVGGYCHTLALTEEGKVLTLGCGEDGQRGDGRPTSNEDWRGMSEVRTGGQPIKDVAAGANHSIAVSKDGQTLWGWGSNDLGQLGPALDENVTVPTPIAVEGVGRGGDTIVSVSAGYAHTAVLTAAGKVFTFGRGNNGQLGRGDAEDDAVPREVHVPQGACPTGKL